MSQASKERRGKGGDGWTRISIMHAPYNPYHAEAFGLIVKLSYASAGRERPRLEIFVDDEEARAREWRIYGPLLELDDPRLAKVQFAAPGEERAFRLGEADYLIRFEAVDDVLERFAGGAGEMMPVYAFSMRKAG